MQKILDTAAKTGFGMARAIAYQSANRKRKCTRIATGNISLWAAAMSLKNGTRNLDARTLFHFTAICVTPAMVKKCSGPAGLVLSAYVDAHGDYLDGSQTYKLHLPPNIPINNFWSVTLYDPDALVAAKRHAQAQRQQL